MVFDVTSSTLHTTCSVVSFAHYEITIVRSRPLISWKSIHAYILVSRLHVLRSTALKKSSHGTCLKPFGFSFPY